MTTPSQKVTTKQKKAKERMRNQIVLSLHSKKEAEFIKKEIIKLLTEYRQKGEV